ncbi:uncharacterized protein VDAG_00760 [Verticillium dahliae VdLs.17]|uniref:PWI domain-containing protein n=1 Tax=Verticillium dahliae (strain VdLs.17 / ATCC MYA-4575 / FGSC 10137) TaxID=498257 RepID=G2WQW8_VERDV|nr:uncharacterized protein VDAG_00760 [Verticillium dahliae VdLs.17]EGY14078.1 hypothetical protein VDAG_00760 [Verticillium dahliae VdLs.17]
MLTPPDNPYGPPPTFGGYPGAAGAGAPGMAPPPGLGMSCRDAPHLQLLTTAGPPPGMSSAPGLAPPPGVQQSNNAQANRQSGLPPNFQAPNIPNNFDFSAPVIRLSALGGKPGPQGDGGRKDSSAPSSGRPGLGMDRRDDQSRNAARDNIQSLVPPTNEERLRTIFIHKIPEGLGADKNIERLLNSVGRLRRWGLSGITTVRMAREPSSASRNTTDPNSFATAAEHSPRHAIQAPAEKSPRNSHQKEGHVAPIPLAPPMSFPPFRVKSARSGGRDCSARGPSIRRDMERFTREEEMEEAERHRNNPQHRSRLDTPPPDASSGSRGPHNAPSGPRGTNGTRSVSFVNGGVANAEYSINREDEESDADDEELYRRHLNKQKEDDENLYTEAERKWFNRERSRQAALERERDREQQEEETFERRRDEQLEREKAWDDEREASRKSHPFYRDHAAWVRKRQMDRADEAARDDNDRRAEADEKRREAADNEHARGMADSFLDRQAQELEQRQQATAAAPAPFKLSLGAAAQRNQQKAASNRRTIAEVEGLLDDEEQDGTAKRQLIPIQFEPTTAADKMTEEELSKAVRALAQEIPSEKEGLWKWDVQWEHLDDSIIREKLRPFVEKKIVEYLGVQEELLVEVVEEHLRKHGKPEDLVEELRGALDDEAEDMAKKLWRMVIFFTESEKRGYPA